MLSVAGPEKCFYLELKNQNEFFSALLNSDFMIEGRGKINPNSSDGFKRHHI